jgi:hypothetical protein
MADLTLCGTRRRTPVFRVTASISKLLTTSLGPGDASPLKDGAEGWPNPRFILEALSLHPTLTGNSALTHYRCRNG